jgi:hypothetical protein
MTAFAAPPITFLTSTSVGQLELVRDTKNDWREAHKGKVEFANEYFASLYPQELDVSKPTANPLSRLLHDGMNSVDGVLDITADSPYDRQLHRRAEDWLGAAVEPPAGIPN